MLLHGARHSGGVYKNKHVKSIRLTNLLGGRRGREIKKKKNEELTSVLL